MNLPKGLSLEGSKDCSNSTVRNHGDGDEILSSSHHQPPLGLNCIYSFFSFLPLLLFLLFFFSTSTTFLTNLIFSSSFCLSSYDGSSYTHENRHQENNDKETSSTPAPSPFGGCCNCNGCCFWSVTTTTTKRMTLRSVVTPHGWLVTTGSKGSIAWSS